MRKRLELIGALAVAVAVLVSVGFYAWTRAARYPAFPEAVALAERARTAVARGDDPAALGASRAIASVEHAKALIPNNVSPALIAATLLRDLTTDLT